MLSVNDKVELSILSHEISGFWLGFGGFSGFLLSILSHEIRRAPIRSTPAIFTVFQFSLTRSELVPMSGVGIEGASLSILSHEIRQRVGPVSRGRAIFQFSLTRSDPIF